MTGKKLHPLKHLEVVSHVPGRIRFKVPPAHRDQSMMRHIKNSLGEQYGADNVKVNHTIGSITVKYNREKYTKPEFEQELKDFDVIASAVMGEGESGGGRQPDVTFLEAVDDLSERVSATTGIRMDLKKALPLTAAGLGVWAIARNGLGMRQIPGIYFLWLALDTFVKLHPLRSEQAYGKGCRG